MNHRLTIAIATAVTGMAVLAGALGPMRPAAAEEGAWPPAWQSKGGARHRLVGTIWNARFERTVTADALVEALADARFRLIGEIHDNPDHHAIQALLLGRLAAGIDAKWNNDRPAVVLEHIRVDKQLAIDRLTRNGRGASLAPEQIAAAAEWEASGWPNFKMFKPLIETILRQRMALVAGDATRQQIARTSREGGGAIEADERKRFALDRPLPAGEADALLAELEASHCGLMPRQAFAGMAAAQRLRDGHLARRMVDAASAATGVVLIAGNGHIRSDRAVPVYLDQMVEDATIVTVAIVEVDDRITEPRSYVPRSAYGKAAADYVIFTPRVSRPDPCEAMRKSFSRPKAPGG